MRAALRLLGRVLLVLLAALVLSNVLVPAVARAQFAAAGGSAVDVLAALLGKTVTATSFVATAASGSNGLACSFNGCRVDFGAGASDYATSNGGAITFNASLALPNGQTISANGFGNVGTVPPQFVSTAGWQFFPGTLPATACGTSPILEGSFRLVASTTGVASKPCWCLKDSSGAFAWHNTETNTVGTTTTCP